MRCRAIIAHLTGDQWLLATHLPADGEDLRTVQEFRGPKDVRTTMICTPV